MNAPPVVDKMDLNEIKDAVLAFMMSGLFGWLIFEIRMTRTSIEELNIKIATIIQQVDFHEKRIDNIEKKINYC